MNSLKYVNSTILSKIPFIRFNCKTTTNEVQKIEKHCICYNESPKRLIDSVGILINNRVKNIAIQLHLFNISAQQCVKLKFHGNLFENRRL